MKRHLPHLAGAALGVLALAMLPLSGLLPHDATGGRGVTHWYHWLAARQSVTLRSLTTPVPPLTDTMARRAAGHYELVCAACHGSPAAPPARIAEDLWPRPPRLTSAQARWRPPARVFLTVRDGIARTAMPSWPETAREDEVWDMVAFLQRLPDLSPQDYRALAGRAGDCTACHGARGEGRDGIPRLDIQTPEYIAAALRAFREGTRASGTMMAVARTLTDDQIDAHARQFGQGIEIPLPATDTPAARIARQGLRERDVPACLSCHAGPQRPTYPALSGQDARYLRRQLQLFAEMGADRGGPHGHMMAQVARWLAPAEMEALADWFAGNNPPP